MAQYQNIIYLNIFQKQKGTYPKLNNSFFKLIYAKSETEFIDYPMMYQSLVATELTGIEKESSIIFVGYNRIHFQRTAQKDNILEIIDNTSYINM